MRLTIMIAAAIALCAGAASAQGLKVQPTSTTSTTANVPTGIEVRGCTWVRNRPGGPYFQVCNQKGLKAVLHDHRYGTGGDGPGGEASK